MSLLKLFKKLRPLDWFFVLLILGLTIFQVWCTMTMADKIADLVASIQYVDYHNNPASAPDIVAMIYAAHGSNWEAVAAWARATGDPNYAVVISIAEANSGLIWANAGWMLLFAFLGVLTQIVIGVFAARITASLVTRVREALYKKIASLSLAEIHQFSTASLITRSTNDIEHVQFAVLFGFRMLFSAPVTAIWASLKINAVSSSLTWVTVTGVSVIIVVLLITMIFVFPKFKITQAYIDRLNGVTRESVLGVRVVRAYNAEGYQEEKFEKANRDLTKLNLFTSKMMSLFNPIITLVLDGVTLGIYYVGASLLKQGDIEYATIISFATLAVQVIMSFMMLLLMFVMIPRAMVSAKRIQDVLSTKSDIVDPENEKPMQNPGEICFDQVSFAYSKEGGDIFSDVSFKVEPGQTLAIIGATGSGKTTLVNLIARLFDCQQGSVQIGGADVRDLKQTTLRQQIGFVPQKANLFSGTVRSNVMLGLENEQDDATLKEALEVACADEFVYQLEGGLEASIASGGTNVSGGQRQRLCIARAVATHPNILVFDDAFSALDFKTDRKVRKNLQKKFPNTTKVIVAQRVGTIMDADLILVLDGGKLVGKGRHEELLKSCEVYKEIALSQLSEEELGL